VRTVDEVSTDALQAFLDQSFRPEKAEFLLRHGGWSTRKSGNRWVIEREGKISAYHAAIPTTLRVGGEHIAAAWWVDLVVQPESRGQGLQRVFDSRVRKVAPLIVGFPNHLAAAIHRRHGWGVREDLAVRMLPLKPRRIVAQRGAGRSSGVIFGCAGLVAAPWARLVRRRLRGFEPRWSQIVETADPEMLAAIFHRDCSSEVTTTLRDEEYLTWRYFDAPYRRELTYIVAGGTSSPRVAVIMRVMDRAEGTVARILDLFGDLSKKEVVRDALRLGASRALRLGAQQVTAMATTPGLSETLRSAGFIVRKPSRFCWSCRERSTFERINSSQIHFVIGDSDNDEP
jgi:hypothetical protein